MARNVLVAVSIHFAELVVVAVAIATTATIAVGLAVAGVVTVVAVVAITIRVATRIIVVIVRMVLHVTVAVAIAIAGVALVTRRALVRTGATDAPGAGMAVRDQVADAVDLAIVPTTTLVIVRTRQVAAH